MRKVFNQAGIVLAVAALFAGLLGLSASTAQAEKWPTTPAACCGSIVGHYADEHLESWNAAHNAVGILDIDDYFISDTLSNGTRVLYFNGGDYNTINSGTGGHFQADYIRIAAEKSPGNYVTIKSYGSTTGPQNTVSATWHIPAQDPFVITDPSDTPAWRWTVCGFIADDPYCSVDYGAI